MKKYMMTLGLALGMNLTAQAQNIFTLDEIRPLVMVAVCAACDCHTNTGTAPRR